MIILILILVFISFFLLVLIFYELKIKSLNLARLKSATKDIINEIKPAHKQINVYEKIIYPLIKKLAPILGKKFPFQEKYREKIEAQLKYCKDSYRFSTDEFIVLKYLSALFGAFASIIVFENNLLPITILASIGFFLPDIRLKEKVTKKKNLILRSIPTTLDLLTACVEAGLSLDSGIHKLVEKSRRSPIIEEFAQLEQELRLGKSKIDGWIDMKIRVDIPEFSAFVSSIIQTQKFGTSIAETLKIQAEEARFKHFQRVEKSAMEMPVKLLFPLIVFIFPTTFIMLFGPIIIQLLKTF